MSDEKHPDDIVRLAKAFNPVQAHVWEQALTAEGIRCRVVGDYLGAGIGDIPGLRSEIWVHQDDAERAKEILAKLSADAVARGEERDDSQDA